MKIILHVGLILLFSLFFYECFSSNLIISNPQKASSSVSFDISWEHSWRENSSTTSLHDAVWVFVKIRPCAEGSNILPFSHLNLNLTGHILSSGLAANPIDAAPDNTGIMLRRANSGNGTTSGTVSLSVNFPDLENYEVRIFGIEMTYIQEGAFYVGDGESMVSFGQGDDLTQPYHITTENAIIPVGESAGSLSAHLAHGGLPSITTEDIPAAFPKGVKAFYCMKTEITQQQYADFLNSLNITQVSNRYFPDVPSEPSLDARYSLMGNWPEIHTNDAPKRACSIIGWEDLTAYLDWAALRPMSELEYEKVCRGPIIPIPMEYPWGNTTSVKAGTIVQGSGCETVSNRGEEGVLCANDPGVPYYGVLDVGFLLTATSSKSTAGAGYYGNLEMAGNVFEQNVTLLEDGIYFTGLRGDGKLTENGSSNVSGWPDGDGGHASRGGSWYNRAHESTVSSRYTILTSSNTRYSNVGGRGCR